MSHDVPVRWHPTVSSTQDVARDALAAGSPAPWAVASDDQRGGRGRLGRAWTTPPGAGLAVTLAHRPTAAPDHRTWYPLAVALGVLGAVGGWLGLPAGEAPGADVLGLKWPNDVHDRAGRKLAGILVETAPDGTLLIGIGLNLRPPVLDADGIEVPGATSLADLGIGELSGPRAAEDLVRAVRRELAPLDDAAGDGGASGVADRYRESCITTGRTVRIETVGPAPDLVGTAVGIDHLGRLQVRDGHGRLTAVSSGDVHHVRPAGPEGETVDERRDA